MKLVIAEKPSVAVSIAKVIGANYRKKNYYEGNGYKVSWCIGHLIAMSNPDSYDDKYKTWNLNDLPIIPSEYKYEVSKITKMQFNILKKLMNDKEVLSVINACDAGREGESIFRLVYNQANCNKPMERLWISSMEDSAIKDGFNNLKPGKDYDNLYEAAESRACADWLVGMNMSRLYSIVNNQYYSVGRVQTPTLAMINKREEEILNFQKEKYFTVDLICDGIVLSTERIDSLDEATRLKEGIAKKITISNVINKEKITRPDLPFDLTTLQRECNKYFSFSANTTLKLAQSLYEKKLLTYPRTDSRYLTNDMFNTIINNFFKEIDYDPARLKIIFNSSKVSDHHAIIPTVSSLKNKFLDINDNEMKVYNLVKNKLLASLDYPLVESITKIISNNLGYDFSTSGKVVIKEGFSKYLNYLKQYTKQKEEVALPNLKVGDVLDVINKEIKEKYTQPLNHFTEDTLLKNMETAGIEALDKNIEVERKGLGTPATRAGIIEALIAKEFIKRVKKNLLITDKGKNLIKIVDNTFKDPITTANWEMKLSNIANGNDTKDNFLNIIRNEISSVVSKYKFTKRTNAP